jgi:HTH-type transcriptional regulator / antitoxin HipB
MTVRSIRDLAAAMHGRRRDLGITQAELARRAGVSRKWIYEFEAGKPTVELGVLLRVLDALDLELELSARSKSLQGAREDAIDLDELLEEHRGDG